MLLSNLIVINIKQKNILLNVLFYHTTIIGQLAKVKVYHIISRSVGVLVGLAIIYNVL